MSITFAVRIERISTEAVQGKARFYHLKLSWLDRGCVQA